MQTYLALLRGVNVGASNRIKMEDLRRVLLAAGFTRVETYIQSGNILFDSEETEEALVTRMESLLETSFGYRGAVVIRSADELDSLIRNLPFTSDDISAAETANPGAESLYVCLFPQSPPAELLVRWEQPDSSGDRFQLAGRNAYLLLKQSIRLSKLATALQKPDYRGTVRNWNTLTALQQMAERRG
ncbi:MAG: DUF1697 domain-containing protein [Clostridiaceae bacterium]